MVELSWSALTRARTRLAQAWARSESSRGSVDWLFGSANSERPRRLIVQTPGAVDSRNGEKLEAHWTRAFWAASSWCGERARRIIFWQRDIACVGVMPGST